MSSKRALQVLWGRVGGLRTAARHDPRDITAPARRAFDERFYKALPEDLPEVERDRRAAAARRAYFAELTARSVRARGAARAAQSMSADQDHSPVEPAPSAKVPME